MTNLTKSTAEPNLRDVLSAYKENIFSSLNCHSIGTIDSFDATKQTASVQLVFRAIFEGSEYQYPLLVDVPVIVLGGSDAFLQIPVNQGDQCIVFFNDVNIDDWFVGVTDIVNPESNRKHDLSDGIALVGLRNLQNSIADFDNGVVRLKNGDAYLTFDENEDIDLNNTRSNLTLKDKINLGNQISDLKTLLDNLIDQVKAIVTIGSPTTQTVSPGSQVALEAIKTQIAAVFE